MRNMGISYIRHLLQHVSAHWAVIMYLTVYIYLYSSAVIPYIGQCLHIGILDFAIIYKKGVFTSIFETDFIKMNVGIT
jgi:hypothetical protein